MPDSPSFTPGQTPTSPTMPDLPPFDKTGTRMCPVIRRHGYTYSGISGLASYYFDDILIDYATAGTFPYILKPPAFVGEFTVTSLKIRIPQPNYGVGAGTAGATEITREFSPAVKITVTFYDTIWQPQEYFDAASPAFRCFNKSNPPSPSPSPTTSYKGGAAPPPPRRNKECDCMSCGCDCNDIATMLARQFAEYNRQIEDLKDFIQKTAVEEVKIHQKQLEAITIDLDLQPVVDRINEVESNLWNGIKK